MNSAVYDKDSTQEVISLSYFTRPVSKTVRTAETTKKSNDMIPHEAMMRMGYNLKMIPKQKDDRVNEIMEIESITTELSKNDIYIPNKTLTKAIVYDNERDTAPKTLGKKEVNGVIMEEPNEEFEVKYPGPGVHLL